MTLYRDPHIAYRQPGEPYRGAPELVPSLDMDRIGNTKVVVVDRHGQAFGELNAATVGDIEWRLNDAGGSDLQMSAYDDNTRKVYLGEREVQVVFQDAIRPDTGEPVIWWGRAVGDSSSPGLVSFPLEDCSSWCKERLITVDKDYGPTPLIEQLDIAWDLIDFCQTGPNMDLNISASYAASGRVRERHYVGDQKSVLWDMLINFTGLIDGFDWHFDYNLAGQTLWVPDYPARGTITGRVFEWGKNVVGYKRTRDTKGLITRYWAQGVSDGAGNKMEQSYEDVPASARFGVREKAGLEGSDNSTLEGLQEAAQRRVNDNKDLKTSLHLAVWEGQIGDEQQSPPLLGSIWPGDWAMVIIDDGHTQENSLRRLISMKKLAAGGLDLEFAVT